MTFGIVTFAALSAIITLLAYSNIKAIRAVKAARETIAYGSKAITVLQESNSSSFLAYTEVAKALKDGYVETLDTLRHIVHTGQVNDEALRKLELKVSELAHIASLSVLKDRSNGGNDVLVFGMTASSIYALRELYIATTADYIPTAASVDALRERIIAERRQLGLLQKATSYGDSITGD